WLTLTFSRPSGLDLVLGEPRGSFHRSPGWAAAGPTAGTAAWRRLLFGWPPFFWVWRSCVSWWFLVGSLPFFWLWDIPLLKVTFAIRALLPAGEEVLRRWNGETFLRCGRGFAVSRAGDRRTCRAKGRLRNCGNHWRKTSPTG
ncbi:MAG: hypothetical protein RMK65_01415, partial [Anaerolineae bacterium]|nr:hypothetical protein [Anaerolineae bacterium]